MLPARYLALAAWFVRPGCASTGAKRSQRGASRRTAQRTLKLASRPHELAGKTPTPPVDVHPGF
ncbi:MAG TPA: hypothetical protein VMV10_32545 [Pirellulales bacterium]|nr:hypothetical protein [Pirellulales bacterium]